MKLAHNFNCVRENVGIKKQTPIALKKTSDLNKLDGKNTNSSACSSSSLNNKKNETKGPTADDIESVKSFSVRNIKAALKTDQEKNNEEELNGKLKKKLTINPRNTNTIFNRDTKSSLTNKRNKVYQDTSESYFH